MILEPITDNALGTTEAPGQQRESIFNDPVGNDYLNQRMRSQDSLVQEAENSRQYVDSTLDRVLDSYNPGTAGMSIDSFTRSAGSYTTVSNVTTIDPEVILETTDSRGEKKTVSLNEFYQEFSDLKRRNEELESRVYKLEERIRFLTEI